jgi:hypothetical protein
MAIIVPILSTFDPKGVNQADKSFAGITKQANILKTALAGIGIAATVKGLQSTVLAASNLSESIAKTNTVFGKNAQAIQDWSRTTASALGVSRQAALEAAGTYGNLFRAFGINEQESAKMSTALVTLAADLASFNNVPIEDALLALRSGLSGETEPLKRFGIALNEARLKEQALADGLIKTTKGTLPQAIKTQAAYSLIMKDSALAQGDVARTAGGLANQLKFLKAGLDDAKAGFGEALLPIVLNVVTALNKDLLPAIKNTTTAFSEQGLAGGFKAAAVEVSNLLNNMTGLAKIIKDVVLALIGMKIAMVALTVGPPIIAAITSALTSMRIATLYGAAGFGVLATAIRGALASTGIGLLVVGLGLVIGKLIETRIQATATDKTIRIMESNGTKAFRGMSQAAQGTIVTINAVALAASRAADELDNAGIKRVKQGRVPPVAVAVPETDTGLAGTAGKAAKAATAVKGLSEAGKLAQQAMAKLGDELARSNDILSKAKDAYANFKDTVKGAITGIIDFGAAATAESGSFLENLVAQAAKAADFGSKVKQLLAMGLSESAISQVLAAGADAGTKIADEIIAGGATVVNQINTLVSATQSVADAVGESAASQFYTAGITAGQALVDGVKAAIAAAGFTINADGSLINQGAINQVNQAIANARSKKSKKGTKISAGERKDIQALAASLGVEVPAFAKGGIVTGPTLALIGEAGPEAVVPLSGRNAGGLGSQITINVNAGMGADGASIGRDIVDAIKRYERTSGPVFASA